MPENNTHVCPTCNGSFREFDGYRIYAGTGAWGNWHCSLRCMIGIGRPAYDRFQEHQGQVYERMREQIIRLLDRGYTFERVRK